MPAFELVLRFVGAALAAYLVGAIPNGVLIGKLFSDVDVRAYGSGKTGATNVLRTLGPGAAALVVIGDIAKGAIAVLLARYVFFGALVSFPIHAAASHAALARYQPWAEALAGLAAVLGHTYSIYIRFSGGRGVLTGAGALLVMSPVSILFGLVAAVVPIALTRYVSLGSVLSATVVPVVELILYLTNHAPLPYLLFTLFGGAYIIVLHRDNIGRLLNGTERKLGERAAQT